ncbi:MAG: S8 family peptidase [Patescibacteria group bacterium]|nr:S8 family peptidase [Patescibacteria group bacterium]
MRIFRFFPLLVIFVFFFIIASYAFSQEKLDRKIIVYKAGVDQKEKLKVISENKAVINKNLRLINGDAITVSRANIQKLLRDPRVLRVDPDAEIFAVPDGNIELAFNPKKCKRFPNLPECQPSPTPISTVTPILTPTITPTSTPSPSLTPTPTSTQTAKFVTASQTFPWGIAKIEADKAWAISSGSGVKVAVIDTGINRIHPDLKANIAGCVNFIISWKTCEDDNGHGTHVSGIIAALNNGVGTVGVAPNAKIYSLKVLDRRGSGYTSDIIEALDWAVSNKMQVVNMSLGTTVDVQAFREAIQRVNKAGIVEVAAAGNSGPAADSVLYPARYPEVIAVSATDSTDNVPYWSSRGPQVLLAAPGVSIYSTYLKGKYVTMSGTSMSAPHVTGTVALRLALYPTETPSEIKSILTANTNSLSYDSNMAGSGLLNAYKVVTAP